MRPAINFSFIKLSNSRFGDLGQPVRQNWLPVLLQDGIWIFFGWHLDIFLQPDSSGCGADVCQIDGRG